MLQKTALRLAQNTYLLAHVFLQVLNYRWIGNQKNQKVATIGGVVWKEKLHLLHVATVTFGSRWFVLIMLVELLPL